jgi:hypothetical protein
MAEYSSSFQFLAKTTCARKTKGLCACTGPGVRPTTCDAHSEATKEWNIKAKDRDDLRSSHSRGTLAMVSVRQAKGNQQGACQGCRGSRNGSEVKKVRTA